MPVYNHAQYVEEAVRSVIAQTRSDWELIAIDDGSTDGSGEILDRLAAGDGRVVVIHQANAGPSVARNAGIARARGEFLAFLDSDDLWFPDTLAAYAGAFEADPAVRFVYGYRHRLNEDGSITELGPLRQDRPATTADLFAKMFLSHLCLCYRRELLEQAGGPYDTTLRSCEDYELYLRVSLHCTLYPLGKATGLRRRHATNISLQSGFSRMQEAAILRRFVQRQGGAAVLDKGLVARRLGQLWYASQRQYFREWCFAQSLQAARQARSYRRTAKGAALAAAAWLLRPLGRSDPRQSTPDLAAMESTQQD